jgi:hypothetical protein
LEGYSAEQVPLILFGMELAKVHPEPQRELCPTVRQDIASPQPAGLPNQVLAEIQPRYITVAFDFFGDPTDDNYRDRNVRRLLYKVSRVLVKLERLPGLALGL